MTPRERPDDGREPTPEEEQAVRRLLAESSADPAIPPDVATRLDDVLAGLVRDRDADGDTHGADDRDADRDAAAGAVPLDSRRRPRTWPKVLVAAAAVSVLGLGVSNIVDGGVGGGGDRMSAADGGDAGGAAESARDSAGPQSSTDARGEAVGPPVTSLTDQRLPRLRSARFAADVERVAAEVLADRDRQARVQRQLRQAKAGCAVPELAPGDVRYVVRLDGSPAVLVLRAPVDGSRLAQAYPCSVAAVDETGEGSTAPEPLAVTSLDVG